MTRAALLLLLPLAAVAAPVKEGIAAKIEKKFGGKIVDPKGDSTFDLDGDKLTITLPAGEERGFGATEEQVIDRDGKRGTKFNYFNHTPRVELDQSGDFTLTVRVHTPLGANANEVKDAKSEAHTAGGVLLIPKEGNWKRVAAVRLRRNEGPVATEFLSDSISHRDTLLGYTSKTRTSETNWIRVIRKGKDFRCELSNDGKEWDNFGDYADRLPDEIVTIALYAQHASDTKHTVTFDQFKIETPKK